MKNYIIENTQKVKTAISLNFLEILVNDHSGFTLDFNGEKVIRKNGYFVSFRTPSLEIPWRDFNDLAINNFITALQCSKNLTKDCFIGLWIDKGIVYLDSTKFFFNKIDAVKFGVQNNQKAIFENKTLTSIYL
jgi:hypothetical protein